MIEFIAHRVNRLEELKVLEKNNGVEIDLRDSLNGLHLSHDPFFSGESFDDYLNNYEHGTMILNIKSERIEPVVLKKISGLGINYFFLDCSFPMIKFLSDSGENNIALRFSEFECMDTIRKMSERVKWVWVDCFTKLPLNKIIYDELKSLKLKICIVSPELQGKDHQIELYAKYMADNNIIPDAICSKVHNKKRWSCYFDF